MVSLAHRLPSEEFLDKNIQSEEYFVGVDRIASALADDAWIAVGAALAAAVVLGLAGLVVTIVRLTRRRAAWPFASATLLLVVLAVAAGVLGYVAAVHPR